MFYFLLIVFRKTEKQQKQLAEAGKVHVTLIIFSASFLRKS